MKARGLAIVLLLVSIFLLLFGAIGLTIELDPGRETQQATVVKRYVDRFGVRIADAEIEGVELRLEDGTTERVEVSGLYRAVGPNAAGKRVLVERQSADDSVTRVQYRDEWYGTGAETVGWVLVVIVFLLGGVAAFFGVRRWRRGAGNAVAR